MAITFTKKIPDELYVDSFTKNLESNFTYDGPKTLKVLVDKESGLVTHILEDDEYRYNPDLYEEVVIDSTKNPDVAEYTFNTVTPERVFEDEPLVDGLVYKRITNPTLRDYFSLKYDFAEKNWVWTTLVRKPESILKDLAEKNKRFVTENLDLIKGDKVMTKVATDYIKVLEDYITIGKGSIPMWKLDEFNLVDVPMIPQELIVAFNKLP